MVTRILKVLWWVGTAGLLAYGCYLYSVNDAVMHHHVDEFIFMVLWVVTFPIGYLAALALGIAMWGFSNVTGLELPGGPVMLVLFGTLISATGFYQWFTLLPTLWKRWRGKTERGARPIA